MTPLALEILRLLIEGYSINEIARRLGRSRATIERELESILRDVQRRLAQNDY